MAAGTTRKNCWVVTDGKAGTENQCIGLAEAVGLPFAVKRILIAKPWTWLPSRLWPDPLGALSADGDELAPPWPDLLIASGRQSAAVAARIRSLSGGRTFTVQIQTPDLPADRYDLVVVPRHDDLRGPNVIVTRGALHRVTAEKLKAEADKFRPALAQLPRPLVAVLIGGSSAAYRLTPEISARLGRQLKDLATKAGFGLAVTASRRTGAENERVLRAALAGTAHVFWDGAGDNPYFGYLGLADAIIVTSDSVSMTSEAIATGKPVYVLHLEGGKEKFDRFHAALAEEGLTRPFEGEIELWESHAVNDTVDVAAEIRRRLDL